MSYITLAGKNGSYYVSNESSKDQLSRRYNGNYEGHLPKVNFDLYKNPNISTNQRTDFLSVKWESINNLYGYSLNSIVRNLKLNVDACRGGNPKWWQVHNAKVWCKTLNDYVNTQWSWYGAKANVNNLAKNMENLELEANIAFTNFNKSYDYFASYIYSDLDKIYELAIDVIPS